MIRFEGVSKAYRAGGETTRVLDSCDLHLEGPAMIAVLGPSGSGKTTILNLIGGIDSPDSGRIEVEGTTVSALSADSAALWRRTMLGYVFQDAALIDVLTASENIQVPMLLSTQSEAKRTERAATLLELVGLGGLAQRFPRELSRGQQQRVSAARALGCAPRLLLCDEPTGNLDVETAAEMMDLFCELRDRFNLTIVLATHDERAAARADVRLRFAGCGLERVP